MSGSEIIRKNGVVAMYDGFPMWGELSTNLSSEERDLIEKLTKDNLVVTNGVTYYVFCTSAATWMQIYSRTGSNELLKYTGVNAPVNYAGPLDWVYRVCKRIATPVGKIEPSVCFGTTRLKYKVEYNEDKCVVTYQIHGQITRSNTGWDQNVAKHTYVVMPVIMPAPAICPMRVELDFTESVIERFFAPLRNDQKMDMLWRIGKALVDPDKGGSIMVLYGRYGHEGKSKLVETLTTLIPDTTVWVTHDLFGKNSKWPNPEMILALSQKRFLVCDECETREGFNYNNVKKWTSGTPVTLDDGTTGYLSQSAFILTNHIPFNEKAAINNSVGRRMVIYHMDKIMTNEVAPDVSEIDNYTIVKFISMAIAMYNSNKKYPPTSLAITLYTFFRRNVNKITAGLIYDVTSEPLDSLTATWVMATRAGVSVHVLVTAFKAMSAELVREPELGVAYIKSLRPMKMWYTKHGLEVVSAMREERNPIIDLDTILERCYTIRNKTV